MSPHKILHILLHGTNIPRAFIETAKQVAAQHQGDLALQLGTAIAGAIVEEIVDQPDTGTKTDTGAKTNPK